MRKAKLLCALVIILLSYQNLTAQILLNPISTSRLDLMNSYTGLDGGFHGSPGSATITSIWKLQFVNNNQLAFVTNGNQIIRMKSNEFYSQVPLIAISGMRSNTNIIADQKIGIGTTNPSEALDISSGVAKANGFLVDGNSNLNSDWGGTWYGLSSGTSTNMPDLDEHTNIKPVVLQGFSGVALRSYGGSLIMDKDGIVMIGLDKGKVNSIAANTTHTHEYGLYVAKGIRSESSRVDLTTAWPDFVFENNYDLIPLDELEIYVNNNHHLPNIPSAATVAKEGIDLGKMNANLLQKVEELTLYVIDLQKQVNELKEGK